MIGPGYTGADVTRAGIRLARAGFNRFTCETDYGRSLSVRHPKVNHAVRVARVSDNIHGPGYCLELFEVDWLIRWLQDDTAMFKLWPLPAEPEAYARQWALEGPRRELPLPSIGGYRGHWQLEGPGKP